MIILIPVNKNNLKAIMDRFAPIVQRAAKQQMSLDGKNATGKTSSSIFAESFEKATSVGIRIGGDRGFIAIHTGRKPGSKMPPHNAIERWASAKGIPLRYRNVKKSIFGIRRSIAENGIPANNISQKAVQNILTDLLSDTSQAYIKDVEQHLKKSSKYARD